jgi:hypothetical protein
MRMEVVGVLYYANAGFNNKDLSKCQIQSENCPIDMSFHCLHNSRYPESCYNNCSTAPGD